MKKDFLNPNLTEEFLAEYSDDLSEATLFLVSKTACWGSNVLGLVNRRAHVVLCGNTITANSRDNYGSSGKGYTTNFQLNGKRIARKKLEEFLSTL